MCNKGSVWFKNLEWFLIIRLGINFVYFVFFLFDGRGGCGGKSKGKGFGNEIGYVYSEIKMKLYYFFI